MLASRAYKIVMVVVVLVMVAAIAVTSAENRSKAAADATVAAAGVPTGEGCPANNTGLKLPTGFCATIFAEGIGHARHLVVSADNVVYVNTWSGRLLRERQDA